MEEIKIDNFWRDNVIANVTETFDLKASTARYFLLESEAGHPLMHIALTTASGERVPSSAMLQLVLLKIR